MQKFKTIDTLIDQLKPTKPVYCIRKKSIHIASKFFQSRFPGKVFYAVKTNPHPEVLKTIIKSGIENFDVASIQEIEDIQKIIRKYNIIDEYRVKKIYPSTINISIKPTMFIARLSGNNQLVGANGKLIEDKENSEILPYVFGEFNSKDFLNLKKDISQSKFTFTKFKMLFFFPSNRWDILTYDDILIKLPQNKISKSLNLAYKIIASNDFKNKNLIDLRINNHLIIK